MFRKVLDGVKWLTQRVTTLLLAAIGLFVIPFLLAKIFQATGLLRLINGLYSSGSFVWFWVLFGVSRVTYGLTWYWLFQTTKKMGHQYGFWWFPRSSSRNFDESVDRSLDIIYKFCLFVIMLVLAEAAIMIYTHVVTPFWL